MFTLRRAGERRRVRRRRQEVWFTFGPQDGTDPLIERFGDLEAFDESSLPPDVGTSFHLHRDTQIVTYVFQGAITAEDAAGRVGIINTGEFQRLTTGPRLRRAERNASSTDGARVFQIWLRTTPPGLDHQLEQRRFSVAQRKAELCLVASPDARRGSLRLHQDALIFSAVLDSGIHLVHALGPDRAAWLHVVRGEVTIGELVLCAGDGVSITGELSVSFTAREDAEILLLDFKQPSKPRRNGEVS
jgi:quercetin 2,3-dioxygenase